MNLDSVAYAFASEAFKEVFGREATSREMLFLLAVSLTETGHGTTWKGDGIGSNNMGAIQAKLPPCDPAKHFEYTDSRPQSDGTSKTYKVCFKRYPNPSAGFVDLVKVLYKQRPSVLAAANSGEVWAVSTAMYDTKYYEGWGATKETRITNHAKAIRSGIKQVSAGAGILDDTTMGEPLLNVDSSSLVAGGVVLAGLAFALWRASKGKS